MILSRRRVLSGLIAAPAIITTPGLLMPVRSFMSYEQAVAWVDTEMPKAINHILGIPWQRMLGESDEQLRSRIVSDIHVVMETFK